MCFSGLSLRPQSRRVDSIPKEGHPHNNPYRGRADTSKLHAKPRRKFSEDGRGRKILVTRPSTSFGSTRPAPCPSLHPAFKVRRGERSAYAAIRSHVHIIRRGGSVRLPTPFRRCRLRRPLPLQSNAPTKWSGKSSAL
jgi:hypothetical protein